MAWHVALVLDTDFSVQELSSLVHQMPIWATDTPQRKAAATRIREAAGEIWSPDPALTLFETCDILDSEELCRNILWTVVEHHPSLATLELIGISPSINLACILGEAGFTPVTTHKHLRFRKSLGQMEHVRELFLDGTGWKAADDLYNSFFEMAGAPVWHGKNFDALHDSIVHGGINGIELPYRIVIENVASVGVGVLESVMQFVELINELEAEGYPVEVNLR